MTVRFSGPIFDGSLQRRVDQALADGLDDAGEAAKREVQRADAAGFRGGSGYTSSRVTVRRVGATGFRVTGGGLVWRRWLEGEAPRNRKSSYKGVAPFKKASRPAGEAATDILTDAVMRVLR
jgi:hypothetical protein